ncbi:hypothetical protein KYB31_07835 [Clostridium felsineum]|uniref:hypothetical protein n=1 Tax=Clostridium felsineum TaxID=36839 RepID=UPI00214DADB8|nr:hypothetical protein [Clostridium felsineum]MCR3758899.1 hypothetical protein [Clostridium felsineum]
MLKLIALMLATVFILFVSLNVVVNFINSMDEYSIKDTKLTRIVIAVIASIALGIIYLKYSLSIEFLKYYFLMIYLIITGYIDFNSKYVYKFFSYIFLGIGLIFLFLSIMCSGERIQPYLIGIGGSFFLSGGLSIFNLLGTGDVEVFTISAIYIGGILSTMNVFLALSLGGFGAIFKLLTGRAKLKDKVTLCPYIALSTYLIIFFVL